MPGQNAFHVVLGCTTVLTALCFGCGQAGDGVPAASGGATAMPSSSVERAAPGLRGVLTDESGQPLPNSSVLACMATVCLFGSSDLQANFVFAIDPPANIALKTPEDLKASPRRGALLIPVHLTQPAFDVGTVRVPNLPAGVAISAADSEPDTYEVGDGLALTLSPADLTPRLGDSLTDLAARRIPTEQVRPLPGLESEQIVAMYALHPFAAKSSAPISVQVSASDLPNGTAVKFRTASELDGQLSEAIPGVVEDGVIRTLAGSGIEELTALVISR